ncbi:hypothetical protein CSKR_203115 [Clonorchis sinensis]|uniref:Transmembrane protein n=1 Tax=Clonorchis sinensis TaxID=79923 RepID=A0A8T1M7Y6_CLOSI|nr:hypothetical protein CSKR_203115 [Clonorchis sinensis]
MLKLLRTIPLLQAAKRDFKLRFHEATIASRRTRMFLLLVSAVALPANVWAFFFALRREHERKEREKIEGPSYARKMPRYVKPLPWGDGKTPFFASMCQYWGYPTPPYLRGPEK